MLQAPDYGKVTFSPKPVDASASRPSDLLSLMPSAPRGLLLQMCAVPLGASLPCPVPYLAHRLTIDPDKRPTAAQLLSHAWFRQPPLPNPLLAM